MKLIFYIDSFYRGGAQRVMSELVNHFAQNVNNEIIAINNYKPGTNSDTYEISQRVKRIYLVSERKGNQIFRNIKMIRCLRSYIKNEAPDVVISFMGMANKRMLIATRRLTVAKIVSVRNDPNKEYGSTLLHKLIARYLFNKADCVVFQTTDAARYFGKRIKSKSEIILNPIGERFYKKNYDPNEKNIISVGRLEPQKNYRLLIEAFAIIADDFPDHNLIIYGEGYQKDDLDIDIHRHNLEGRVFLPGNQNNVEDVLSKAKLFVLSSDYEGLPNALMEAMAVGVPVISTDCPCGGPKELTQGGKTGILTDCGNSVLLAEKIRNVLNMTTDQLLELSDKEKTRASEFSLDVIMKQWETCIENSI